jgi:tagaturonate reductase
VSPPPGEGAPAAPPASPPASPSGLPRLDRTIVSLAEDRPEKVLQFGEGNFLRAFVDWMLDRMNGAGLFNGRAVLVQPIAQGLADVINAQDGLYTVVLRGRQNGRVVDTREVVRSVSRCIDPHRDFEAFLACATSPDLRFVVSNTTEAGIRVDAADRPDSRPCPSFPGKLTQLLLHRFRHFDGDPDRGLVMLPCELIERNGDQLRRAVEETARRWELPAAFLEWVDRACLYTNTLVDRIVTGYPRDEAAELQAALGYEDRLLVAAEVFHAWVIESPRPLEAELPLREVGLDVVWTTDVTPYRERKVRILNGAHTMSVLAAFLAGLDTVGACMADPTFRAFIEGGIAEEVLPTLTLPRAELESFAGSVSERFANPFIKHQLLSISLNSVSKFKARILGTMLDYRRLRGNLPPRLTFSLAALLAFYRGATLRDGALLGARAGSPYRIEDEPGVLDAFHAVWAGHAEGPVTVAVAARVARTILARADLWGRDLEGALPGLTDAVAVHLAAICTDGARAALARV